ncbi:MAG: DUF2157 domain-containing protein [Elusimicrobiota bacterium]
MSYYKRLQKDLKECAEKGIITDLQAQESYNFIYSKKKKLPQASHIVIAVGGLLISLGLILIISFNWNKIGDLTKIISYLLIYSLIGICAIKYSEKSLITIPLNIIWFFMPALGFGLYGQIFQLSSDPVKPYIAWAIICAPLVWFYAKKYLVYLFEALVYGIIIYQFFEENTSFTILTYNIKSWDFIKSFIIISVFILFIKLLHEKVLKEKTTERVYFISILTLYQIISHFLKDRFSPFIIVFAIFMFIRKYNFLYLLILLLLLYIFSFKDPYSRYDYNYEIDTFSYVLSFIISLIVYLLTSIKILKNKNLLSYPLISLLLISFTIPFLNFEKQILALIMNPFIVWFSVSLIIFGINNREKKIANLAIYYTALIIITRFIDLFGFASLLKSGIGFITSGLLLILIALGLNKLRKKLTESL